MKVILGVYFYICAGIELQTPRPLFDVIAPIISLSIAITGAHPRFTSCILAYRSNVFSFDLYSMFSKYHRKVGCWFVVYVHVLYELMLLHMPITIIIEFCRSNLVIVAWPLRKKHCWFLNMNTIVLFSKWPGYMDRLRRFLKREK